jgi:hypothetical protein
VVPIFGTCDVSKSGGKLDSSDFTSIDGRKGRKIIVSQRIERKPNIKLVFLCLNRKKTIPVIRKSQNIVKGSIRKFAKECIKQLVDKLVIPKNAII